ncbi:MAG: V4R domain-containing protein [Thermoplasmata archaeon]
MKLFEDLYSVRFLPEAADIRVAGASYFLMRREAYCELTRELRKTLGRGAEAILFRAGYERAKEFYPATVEFTRSEEPEEVVDAARFLSAHLGLYRVVSFSSDIDAWDGSGKGILSKGPRARLLVERSFEVCNRHPSGQPRCQYIRGFWTGLVEKMHGEGRRFVGTEVECEGAGARRCRLEFSLVPVF